MKHLTLILALIAAVPALAITATKEYVDRRDQLIVTNSIPVATNATFALARAYTDAAIAGAGMSPVGVTNISRYVAGQLDIAATNAVYVASTNVAQNAADAAYLNATNQAAISAAAKYKPLSWFPTWGQVTSKPSWIGSEKPSYTAVEVGALSTADGGYVDGDIVMSGFTTEESGGETIYRSNALQFGAYATDGGYEFYVNDDLEMFIRWCCFDEGLGEEFWRSSQLIPDGTPFMTAGTADFLLTNAVDYGEYIELRSGVMYNIYFETPTVPIFTINFGNDLMRGCDIMLRIVNDQDIVFEIESDNVIIDGNEWTGEVSAGTNLLMITKTAFLPDEGTDGKSVIMITNKEIK